MEPKELEDRFEEHTNTYGAAARDMRAGVPPEWRESELPEHDASAESVPHMQGATSMGARSKGRKPPEQCKRNPEIHRRYHAKKRAGLASLEEQVVSKMQQLNLLMARNVQMKLREKVLRTYIAARDEQLQSLQQHHLAACGRCGCGGPRSGRDGGGNAVGGGGGSSSFGGGSGSGAGGAPLGMSHAAAVPAPLAGTAIKQGPEHPPKGGPDGISGPRMPGLGAQPGGPDGGEGTDGSSAGAGAHAADAGWPGGHEELQGYSQMTQARMNQVYADYVQQMAKLLPVAEGPNCDPAAYLQVEELMREMDDRFKCWCWLDPGVIMRTSGRHIFNPSVVADPSLWRDIAGRIGLHVERSKALLAAWDEHQAAISAVNTTRHRAAAQLRDAPQRGQQEEARVDAFEERFHTLRALSDAANTVRGTLEKEAECWLVLFKAMHRVTPPFERAKVQVMAYPYWPDGMELYRQMRLLALAHQEERQAGGDASAGTESF